MQPYPINIPKVNACCRFLNNADDEDYDERKEAAAILQCVNSTFTSTSDSGHKDQDKDKGGPTSPRVAIMTYVDADERGPYAIPSIWSFASYQVAVMAAYAEHNGYDFRVLTPQQQHQQQHQQQREAGAREGAEQSNPNSDAPMDMDVNVNVEVDMDEDVRWAKVQLLMQALDPASGWARESSFLVWVDADLLVLDLGLSIEQVGEQYPHADLIASADVRMGYINSGFLLLRNTAFTRLFLARWLRQGRVRVKGHQLCDQVFLCS